ncbi:MAG: uracil-DNA glycosylase [Proteobacteria bacterium]|nr:uracil-DNA glycosylase [Pseudomonadota bacterium]
MGIAPTWFLRSQEAGADRPVVSANPAETTRSVDSQIPTQSPIGEVETEGMTPSLAREARIAAMDWAALKAAVGTCTACGLRAGCTQTVFGVGDEQADWLLVGEAPGQDEDRQGEPFVGQAGKLLDGMLASIQLKRGENVYIANVLKCRPPGNRNPAPEEVAKCAPHLLRQVALLRPKLILAMGRFAVQALLKTEASIASLRGRQHQYAGVPLIVTYHPAYLLRTLPDKAKAWQDLLLAKRSMVSLKKDA